MQFLQLLIIYGPLVGGTCSYIFMGHGWIFQWRIEKNDPIWRPTHFSLTIDGHLRKQRCGFHEDTSGSPISIGCTISLWGYVFVSISLSLYLTKFIDKHLYIVSVHLRAAAPTADPGKLQGDVFPFWPSDVWSGFKRAFWGPAVHRAVVEQGCRGGILPLLDGFGRNRAQYACKIHRLVFGEGVTVTVESLAVWVLFECIFRYTGDAKVLDTFFFNVDHLQESRMRQRMACWGLRCFCAKSCGEKCRAERLKALFSTRDGRRRTYRKKMVWEKMLYLLLWLQIQSFLIIWWLRLRCGEARQQVWRGACLIWCNVLRHKPTT